MGCLIIHEGCSPSTLSPALIPTYLTRKQLATLKPVNAWMDFRSKCHSTQQRVFMLTVCRSLVCRWAEDPLRHGPVGCLASCENLLRLHPYYRPCEHCYHVHPFSRQLHAGVLSLSEFVKTELKIGWTFWASAIPCSFSQTARYSRLWISGGAESFIDDDEDPNSGLQDNIKTRP
jgi:hypothetical protein